MKDFYTKILSELGESSYTDLQDFVLECPEFCPFVRWLQESNSFYASSPEKRNTMNRIIKRHMKMSSLREKWFRDTNYFCGFPEEFVRYFFSKSNGVLVAVDYFEGFEGVELRDEFRLDLAADAFARAAERLYFCYNTLLGMKRDLHGNLEAEPSDIVAWMYKREGLSVQEIAKKIENIARYVLPQNVTLLSSLKISML